MFDWKWYLSDIKQDKDIKVFSCFSCGGGSSMGYKRAGFQVIGNVEIDPQVNAIYKKNLNPKYNYLMDLRQFNQIPNEELPEELFNLDILDGSPPCTTFSVAGKREETWGQKKKFREGQTEQVLDDLFFVFLDTVEKLKPKVVVAENVAGLLKGNAKGYVNQIIKRFHSLGYEVQLFKLNAAKMNVPQSRERVFFIANNQGFPKLKLSFNGKPILFGEVRTEHGQDFKSSEIYKELLKYKLPTDKKISDISERVRGKYSGFNHSIIHDNEMCRTIAAHGRMFRYCDGLKFSDFDFINCSSFPQDYNFSGMRPQYMCGMSVPPNMMANIAAELYKQWLKQQK